MYKIKFLDKNQTNVTKEGLPTTTPTIKNVTKQEIPTIKNVTKKDYQQQHQQ